MTLIEPLKQDFGQDVEWEEAITLITKPYVEALEKCVEANPTIDLSKPDAFKYIASVEASRKTLAAHREIFGEQNENTD